MATAINTCIHAASGLCPQCQADYDEDPIAYIEFGEHPAGIARWQAERAMIEAEAQTDPPCVGVADDEIPF